MDDEGGAEDAEMMAAMGFSSFGAAPLTRKRKFNDEATTNSEGKVAPKGTGANSSVLGMRNVSKTKSNRSSSPTIRSATSGSSTDRVVDNKSKGKAKALEAGGLAAFLFHGQNLPARPNDENFQAPQPRAEAVQTNHSPSMDDYRRGVRNENGDLAYFLPSFLEDPWKDLK